MGMLMIRCPKTGRAIHTGKRVERTVFRATPVFFSRTYRPLCCAIAVSAPCPLLT